MKTKMKYSPTRFNDENGGLFYGKQDEGLWRIFFREKGESEYHAVGPQYKTRIELLCDINRYGHDYGYQN